jgi:hypothetical protein
VRGSEHGTREGRDDPRNSCRLVIVRVAPQNLVDILFADQHIGPFLKFQRDVCAKSADGFRDECDRVCVELALMPEQPVRSWRRNRPFRFFQRRMHKAGEKPSQTSNVKKGCWRGGNSPTIAAPR